MKHQRLFLVEVLQCITLLCTVQLTIGQDWSRQASAKQALDYVERVRTSPCTGGTEETLPVDFDHSMWNKYADVAVKTSNLLTKLVIEGNGTLGTTSAKFLFDIVRNNVDDTSPVFGSAIAVEEYVYPEYRIFCPYAYKNNRVYSHDISLNYNYLSNTTEWYHSLRIRDWSNASVTENLVTYRLNTTSNDIQTAVSQPVATIGDGHWTRPYYDCGGGDIWMVTYSSPVFFMNASTKMPIFKGIATIDIELTNIDINQCDLKNETESEAEETSSVDVFRGTHQCQPSTKCIHKKGHGFTRGSYECVCRDGYYFPDIKAARKSFNGTEIELYLSKKNASNDVTYLERFKCLKCAEGCETCVDDSPCLFTNNIFIRLPLLVLSLLLLCFILLLSVIVALHQQEKPIKSASPIFLQVINGGAVLMCIPMLLGYAEPSVVLCAIKPWPRYIGFFLAYGALLLKTWRVATIFRVKSAKRLNLSDRVLARRFIPIACCTVAYLAAWTATTVPSIEWRKTRDDLKFLDCPDSYWSYIAQAGEACFLLWGAYLSFIVRKAPSHFNESKYITWAIYNDIILGNFIIIIRMFIAVHEGPDILYLVDYLYLQVSVTSTVLLIYVPKIYQLYQSRRNGDKWPSGSSANNPPDAAGTVSSVQVGPMRPGRQEKHSQTDLLMSDLKGVEPSGPVERRKHFLAVRHFLAPEPSVST